MREQDDLFLFPPFPEFGSADAQAKKITPDVSVRAGAMLTRDQAFEKSWKIFIDVTMCAPLLDERLKQAH